MSFQSDRPTKPTLERLSGVLCPAAVACSKVVEVYPTINYFLASNRIYGNDFQQRVTKPFHVEKDKFYLLCGEWLSPEVQKPRSPEDHENMFLETAQVAVCGAFLLSSILIAQTEISTKLKHSAFVCTAHCKTEIATPWYTLYEALWVPSRGRDTLQ